ncbi:MAG TPA: BamA/TamA family outer membrane protein [Longimicrobiales bacterium]|nr:BamA/TamA family outer membrane protein [Longimicrobiales bacterium]
MTPTPRPLGRGTSRRDASPLRLASWLGALAALLAVWAAPARAQSHGAGPAAADSSGADPERCAEGVISAVEVESRAIYDPSSTSIAPLAWTYGALNLLHINTAESFIRGELLFEEGDCFDAFLLSETYRLLDGYGFLYVDEITEEPDGNGGYRVLVATRDEWSTKVDIGPTYDEGGLNLERLQVTEENFLGRGVFGEYTYYARRETKTQSFGVRTPRFFGRSDAGLAVGSARPGNFFEQYWRYPFVGEAGHWAVREGYRQGTDYFAYGTNDPSTQVLVPVRREFSELSGAYRFGRPGASLILGATLARDVVQFRGGPEVTYGDYDVREPLPGPVPANMQRQLRPFTATRAALHLGTRRFRYVDYTGLDDLRHTDLVGLGSFFGVTLGRTLPIFEASRAPAVDDYYVRGHATMTIPVGAGLFIWGTTLEARHEARGWQDVLADADVAAYARSGLLPGHTLFFRASGASGWETTLPYQLSLGGREGVRSLDEDRFPGGRMVRFVLEDRIVLPWPEDTADLGLTLFSDLGRVWAGDAPYGVDSRWEASLGFGLRIGLPRGTRHIWRADIAFPVGASGGGPQFRITAELNKLRSGFFTPDLRRSRRFAIGPETF